MMRCDDGNVMACSLVRRVLCTCVSLRRPCEAYAPCEDAMRMVSSCVHGHVRGILYWCVTSHDSMSHTSPARAYAAL